MVRWSRRLSVVSTVPLMPFAGVIHSRRVLKKKCPLCGGGAELVPLGLSNVPYLSATEKKLLEYGAFQPPLVIRGLRNDC